MAEYIIPTQDEYRPKLRAEDLWIGAEVEALRNNHYGYTTNGWRGVVKSINAEDETMIINALPGYKTHDGSLRINAFRLINSNIYTE